MSSFDLCVVVIAGHGHDRCLLLCLETQKWPEQDHKHCCQSCVDQDIVHDQGDCDLRGHSDSTLSIVTDICEWICKCHTRDGAKAKYDDSNGDQPNPVVSAPLEPVPHGVCTFHEKELDQDFAADIKDQANVDGRAT